MQIVKDQLGILEIPLFRVALLYTKGSTNALRNNTLKICGVFSISCMYVLTAEDGDVSF